MDKNIYGMPSAVKATKHSILKTIVSVFLIILIGIILFAAWMIWDYQKRMQQLHDRAVSVFSTNCTVVEENCSELERLSEYLLNNTEPMPEYGYRNMALVETDDIADQIPDEYKKALKALDDMKISHIAVFFDDERSAVTYGYFGHIGYVNEVRYERSPIRYTADEESRKTIGDHFEVYFSYNPGV